MKQLLVILLIILSTCIAFEEDYDDGILEKKKFNIKNIASPNKTITKPVEKVENFIENPGQVNKQTGKDFLNNLFKGCRGMPVNSKFAKALRKLPEDVKTGINLLIKRNLWSPLVQQIRSHDQKFGNEFCERLFPPNICRKIIDFILDTLIENGN